MVKNRKLIKMNFVYTFNLERNPLTVLDLSPNSVLTLSKLSRALVTIFVAGAGGRTLLSPWPFGPYHPRILVSFYSELSPNGKVHSERSTLAARLGPALKSASAEMPCLTERSGPALMYHLSSSSTDCLERHLSSQKLLKMLITRGWGSISSHSLCTHTQDSTAPMLRVAPLIWFPSLTKSLTAP